MDFRGRGVVQRVSTSRGLRLTPELQGELSRPMNARGRGLVQRESNDVCIYTVTIWHTAEPSHPAA